MSTYSLHPGVIFTPGITAEFTGRYLTGNQFIADLLVKYTPYIMKGAVEGAQTQICCAVDPALSQESGQFYMYVHFILPTTFKAIFLSMR